jgi:hypothetical protein
MAMARRSSTGYSFAAVPSPMSTPASTGLLRAHAQSAPLVRAMASRSQLVKACSATRGERAKIAAS